MINAISPHPIKNQWLGSRPESSKKLVNTKQGDADGDADMSGVDDEPESPKPQVDDMTDDALHALKIGPSEHIKYRL